MKRCAIKKKKGAGLRQRHKENAGKERLKAEFKERQCRLSNKKRKRPEQDATKRDSGN